MPEIQDVVNKLRAGVSVRQAPINTFNTTLKAPTSGYEGAEYNVSKEQIYDRLNDGSLVAKFDNYKGGVGNEDRLARQQSSGEQWFNGLTKNLGKVVNYAIDSTIGTGYGIVSAISSGDFSDIYDNDFGKAMDDANKKLDYNLPNYYSDEQKSKGLLGSLTTANFWANDVAGGLAFVGGALLPGAAMTLATGGATAPSLGVSLGKRILKATFKSGDELLEAGAKTVTKSADELVGSGAGATRRAQYAIEAEKGTNIFKAYQRAMLGKKGGDIASTAGFLARSSSFEAGMEARQNLKTSMDSFLENYEEKNGRPPTYEEIQKFSNDAVQAANGLYGANMAILALSNSVMFGKTLGVVGPNTIKSINNFGNRIIGLGVKTGAEGIEAGISVARGANKLQKITGRTYKALSKPLTEGLYEEGFQGVASKTMQDYLETKYDPKNTHGYDMFASITDAFSDQYGTKEGWKEMGVGMIIGFAGGAIQGQGFEGFGKNSYKYATEKLQQEIASTNEGVQKLRGLNRATSARVFANRAQEGGTKASVSNTISNIEFIKSQESVKSPAEIKKDFEAVINSTQLDEATVNHLGSEDNAIAYKANLISEFNRNIEDYTFAKKAVRSVGLDQKIKDTPGQLNEVGEALTMNLVLGKHALYTAQNLGEHIDKLVGTNGIYDHLQFYNSLTQDRKQAVQDLREKQDRLKDLEDTAIKLGQSLATTQQTGKGNETLVNEAYQKVSEKMVITEQEASKLQAEIDQLTKTLSKDFRATNLELDGTISVAPSANNILNTVEQLDRLDDYKQALIDNGKPDVAETLDDLISEFKKQSDAHREVNNTARKMMDTNFFSTSEGSKLLDSVTGKRYKMSDDFKKVLQENDDAIDRSLSMFGIRGTDQIEAKLKAVLEENQELSEREKYRLEAILRLQLTQKNLQDEVDAQIVPATIGEVTEDEAINPLEGDTVSLKERMDITAADITTVEVLDKAIKTITDQIDHVVNRAERNKTKIQELEEQLQTLKQERDAIKESSKSEEQKISAESSITKREGAIEGEPIETIGQETPTEADISNQLLSSEEKIKDIDKQISETEAQITELSKPFKIVDSKEYKRFAELTRKLEQGEDLSDDEKTELNTLQEDINQWLLITGTVANGLRLSDLIRQREVLDTTTVTELEKPTEALPDDVIEGIKFTDVNKGNANYSLAQTYDAVVVSARKDGNLVISGISKEDLEELAGIGKIDTVYDENNTQNNIIITQDTAQEINENTDSGVSIMPTNSDMTSTFSFLIKHTVDINGNSVSTPLKNTFQDFNSEMNVDAIYDIINDEAVTLSIDPNDEYNIKLIEAYQSATGKKKQEALEELKAGVVIRVKHNDKFVAVLKGKSKRNKAADRSDEKFEMMRDMIVEMPNMLDNLEANTEISLHDLKVSVVQVLPGHPTFLMTRNSDGSVNITYKNFDDQMVSKIEDIGFVDKGIIETRSGEKGLDTTFITKYADNRSKERVPFVVIRKGNKRIAYPVKLAPQAKKDNSGFSDIYNSETLTITQKVVNLNKFMAERGIDIKDTGNAFFSANLTDVFFQEKLNQLDSIDYYYSLEDWVKPDSNIGEILKQQAAINIDLSNPVHSPKIKLNFDKVYAKITLPEVSPEQKGRVNRKTLTSSNTISKSAAREGLEEKRKNCKD